MGDFADIAPKNAISSLSGLQNFGGNLGGALAPIVTGYLFSVTHSFQLGLIVAGGVALIFGVFSCIFLLGKIDGNTEQTPPSTPTAPISVVIEK